MVIEQGAHTAENGADQKVIADTDRPILYHDGGNRPLTAIQLAFENGSDTGALGIGCQLFQIRDKQNHFQQQVEVLLRVGRDGNHDGVPTPVLGKQSAIGELLLNSIWVRALFINFIDSHNQRNAGRLGVIHGFESLRHHTIISGNDENHNIGDLRATGPHPGKRLMPGRIDENDSPAVLFDVVGADGLRDPARLAFGDIRLPDCIEQRRLTVIDVTHHGDHGSAREQVADIFGLLGLLHRFLFESCFRRRRPELCAEIVYHLQVESLVDRREQAAID